jgi:hypothetical protein
VDLVGVDLREIRELLLERVWEEDEYELEYRLIAEEELREEEDLTLVVDRLGVE